MGYGFQREFMHMQSRAYVLLNAWLGWGLPQKGMPSSRNRRSQGQAQRGYGLLKSIQMASVIDKLVFIWKPKSHPETSQVERLVPGQTVSVQSEKTISQSVIANTAGAIQGLQMHVLLFSVVLKPVLLIFTVLLSKLAGICLRKTALGAAQSNLATFYPRRIIVSYLNSLCQQNKTGNTQIFKLFQEVVYVVIALCTETCSVQLT